MGIIDYYAQHNDGYILINYMNNFDMNVCINHEIMRENDGSYKFYKPLYNLQLTPREFLHIYSSIM